MSDVSDINTLLKKWGVFMSNRDIIRKMYRSSGGDRNFQKKDLSK